MSGNRCNHNPDSPSLNMRVDVPESLPKILQRLLERVDQYFSRPSMIPSLNAANKSTRQQRSERREACIQVLKSLIRFTDLTTLKVAVPNHGELADLKHCVMLDKTNLTESRYKRAIHDLKASGIITITRVVNEVAPGVYEGRAAVKCLSKQLFGVFGLGAWLEYERKKSSNRARREEKASKPKRANRADVARAKLHMASVAAEREQKNRVRNALITKLKSASPELSWPELAALADLQLT